MHALFHGKAAVLTCSHVIGLQRVMKPLRPRFRRAPASWRGSIRIIFATARRDDARVPMKVGAPIRRLTDGDAQSHRERRGNMSLKRSTRLLLALAVAVLAACDSGGPSEPTNEQPTLTVEPAIDVDAGDAVTLSASASDPDGDALTYTWTQVSGPPVGPLSGATPSFSAPDDVVTLAFDVTVSDGTVSTAAQRVVVRVWDDFNDAVFVSPDGSDDNAGSMESPLATIEAAIAEADARGGSVMVGTGVWTEQVVLKSNVDLYGGFDENWHRDPENHVSRIEGPRIAVIGDHVENVRIDGLHIASATPDDQVFDGSTMVIALVQAAGIEVIG